MCSNFFFLPLGEIFWFHLQLNTLQPKGIFVPPYAQFFYTTLWQKSMSSIIFFFFFWLILQSSFQLLEFELLGSSTFSKYENPRFSHQSDLRIWRNYANNQSKQVLPNNHDKHGNLHQELLVAFVFFWERNCLCRNFRKCHSVIPLSI